MKRRHFLQAASSTFTTLALSQWGIICQGDRYAQVLAQSTPRKLALLVGIDKYLGGDRQLFPLSGCNTDVDLQHELLTHRFGFQETDIKILRDGDATRDRILETFQTHLIEQAKPGDVVVFHFSGHGSQILDPNPIKGQPLNSTFVPFDAVYRQRDGSVNDIMGSTLFLLMSALQTHNFTAVLDCCYSGGGTRGTARVRSAPGGKQSVAEREYQQRWLKQLNLSPQEFLRLRTAGVAKGAVLAAALRQQEAQDWTFSGKYEFNAGAFTYLLTQYLWAQTATINDTQSVIPRSLKSLTGYQEPVFDLEANSTTKPIYFTPAQKGSAQAVVQQVIGNKAKLWLGGLDPQTLEAFAPGSTFTILDTVGRGAGNVTLESRQGLTAMASVSGSVQRGTLLQESSRVIPNDIKLRIGLDLSLTNEFATIKAALTQLNRIEVVPAQTGDRSYATGVNYILSRVIKAYHTQIRTNEKPPLDSIALFSSNLEVLPKSFEQAGESATIAINRLSPKLQSLVAAHLVRQTLNAKTSNLNVEVQLHPQKQPDLVIAKASTRSIDVTESKRSLSLGTPFQFKISSHETTPLYLLIAFVSPSGKLAILFPNIYTDGDLKKISQIAPQSSRLVPNPNDGDAFKLLPQVIGQGEALIVTSRQPLDAVFKRLQTLAAEQSTVRGPIERGADAMTDLLSDLSTRSTQSSYSISTNDVATLSITFEITNKNS